ncbi:MAG: ABC transporter ATP-binding protein [Deltaproteobacteria bacterium]|nr:MAG: ABC transporter ATP-binding protein [Deltaproteobacteria bacterium]
MHRRRGCSGGARGPGRGSWNASCAHPTARRGPGRRGGHPGASDGLVPRWQPEDPMLTATDVAMQFGGQTLFEDVNLQLDAGQRYGLVGANGSGKSTLLRLLCGDESSTQGSITCRKNARIGTLEQDHFQYDDVPILHVVMMGNEELWRAMVEKEKVLAEAETYFDEDRYSQLEDIVLRFDGYAYEARAGEILEGLGVPVAVHEQPLRTLSGGFKLRVLLAKVLASEPDIIFLDEPTNHLDILAVKWLEDFLASFRGLAVIVSHDRRFLDAACTHILDVDYERVMVYKGNYTAFEAQKEEERTRQEAEIDKRQQEIDDHKAFIARFSAKATKARQANSRKKQLEKIEITQLPRTSRRHPHLAFHPRRHSGRVVVEARDLGKRYGDKLVLDGIDIEVIRGEKVAIIGPNGIGKSTLLKILMGEVQPDQGEVAWGYETHVGYAPQDHTEALGDPTGTVMTSLWETIPDEGQGGVIGRLAAVLFTREDCDKPVQHLSGGEGMRLLFAKIAASEPNVLVMDEPTNHLDLEGIESLAKALRSYEGTLILVSHDRWLVEQVATRIVEISPSGVRDFKGSYQDFVRYTERDHLDVDAVVATERAGKRQRKRGSR